MKKTIGAIIVSTFFLSSCGPSKAEIEANLLRSQAIRDSINMEMQRDTEKQESLKQTLIDLKAQLSGEEEKMASIQDFKVLRTEDEKVQQIADQTKIIEEVKAQIINVNSQIK